MYKNLGKNKGITLVALVVTVIILLILAGISIASLTGNGLFEKAKLAKEKQENAQIKENQILGEYENEINKSLVTGSTRNENINLNYSTTEKKVGSWIDGSPIYQITRFYDNNGAGYGQGIHNLENIKQTLNANMLINYNAIMSKHDSNYELSKYALTIPNQNIFINYENEILKFNFSTSTTKKWKLYVTLQYTKSNT